MIDASSPSGSDAIATASPRDGCSIHNPYTRFNDEGLLAKLAKVREAAGGAPKAIDNPSNAWARHGAEWARLCDEVKRRSLAPTRARSAGEGADAPSRESKEQE